MSERDVIGLLAETRDWLREVQIGDAVPAIDTGIAEITSLRDEVERLRMTAGERVSMELAVKLMDLNMDFLSAHHLRAVLARHGGDK